MDESTDISVQQVLSVTVRYFSPRFNEIKETFLDLVNCNSGSADSLFQLLKNVVESWGLDPEKFVGLGTDGAAAMVGRNHSLQSLARQEYPNLTHMKCSPHTADLCARDAMDIMPAALDFLTRESYCNWFAHSSQRQNEFKDVLELVGFDRVIVENEDDEENPGATANSGNRPPMKMIKPSTTRWLVMADCVERILMQVISFLNL